jgi:type VI secretion system secreted protein VgrG
MQHGFFDTAVRDACMEIEHLLKTFLETQRFGQRLVSSFEKAMHDRGIPPAQQSDVVASDDLGDVALDFIAERTSMLTARSLARLRVYHPLLVSLARGASARPRCAVWPSSYKTWDIAGMPRLPQLELQVNFEDGPDASWHVGGLHFEEVLNELYEAGIEIETDELDADLADLLGATCELMLRRGEHPPRPIYGVVARVDDLGATNHHAFARVTVVPAFALSKQRINTRIWQDRSVQDIVREVLDASLSEYGRSVELGHLRRGAKPRDYCVQYGESDYDFICRLLEEEGITWYFVHDLERGHEVVTLCDDNENYDKYVNVDDDANLPIISHNPEEAELESIQQFAWSRKLTPTTVALSAFDPRSPGGVSSGEKGSGDARGRVRRVYAHVQARLGSAPLEQRLGDLEQALRADASLAGASSNAALVRVGQRIVIDGAAQTGTPLEWIVTGIEHHWGGELVDARVYTNNLRCVPANVPLRPHQRHSKPRVYGPQTATVVGGGEIDVDAQGRIQVQFHWQENPQFTAGASCRVRCAQSWAGAGWGAQFIPRVGMEVVVEFLEGSPDRPLVTGCVYNGANDPPFTLPGSSTQSGWRSNSSPGGGGSNELRFEDAAGLEQIYLHGQKDWAIEIKHDKTQRVGNNESLAVGNDRQKFVVANEREQVGANKRISVGSNHTETIGANMNLRVGASQTVEIAADQNVTVAGSRIETIGADASETVAQLKSVTVAGMFVTAVGGAMNTSVAAASLEEIGGSKTISVGASSSEIVVGGKSVEAAAITHSARADLNQKARANLTLTAGKDLQAIADGNLGIFGKGAGLLEFGTDLTLKVGKASITLKTSGEVVIEGTNIDIKGSNIVNVN